MDNDKKIGSYPVYEYDQVVTRDDLEVMIKYNKAVEALLMLSRQDNMASQAHAAHVFTEALLKHLDSGKIPSFYDAWELMKTEIPDELRELVLEDTNTDCTEEE